MEAVPVKDLERQFNKAFGNLFIIHILLGLPFMGHVSEPSHIRRLTSALAESFDTALVSLR
jgi:hypothetical protein